MVRWLGGCEESAGKTQEPLDHIDLQMEDHTVCPVCYLPIDPDEEIFLDVCFHRFCRQVRGVSSPKLPVAVTI